jgi:quercetin dioxygenase-like cupin family protein
MLSAESEVAIEDDSVRATRWSFSAGSETGHHVHAFDYVVVPITGGTFTVAMSSGEVTVMEQAMGEPYRGRKGTSHNVRYEGEGRAVFVEVELKG